MCSGQGPVSSFFFLFLGPEAKGRRKCQVLARAPLNGGSRVKELRATFNERILASGTWPNGRHVVSESRINL